MNVNKHKKENVKFGSDCLVQRLSFIIGQEIITALYSTANYNSTGAMAAHVIQLCNQCKYY